MELLDWQGPPKPKGGPGVKKILGALIAPKKMNSICKTLKIII